MTVILFFDTLELGEQRSLLDICIFFIFSVILGELQNEINY
ncbi:hypothetical protein HMPREF3186_01798 [Gemella haemolysans]|uniref:Uncharacterized protein n=1 Tax=Gemella haemolysans TaxID=1379 RepID=A0A133ZP97_9BACL|nr:hypothetical protein HMPREF3186_01798 [Gemella haemolysans]